MPSKTLRLSKTKSKILVVGNWKMNPVSYDESKRIFSSIKTFSKKLKKTSVVMCPPSVFAANFRPGSNVSLGVQNVYSEDSGSFTGEISSPMVQSIGCNYVIVGHSERRKSGETDEIISLKVASVIKNGLKAIVCVGETSRDDQGEYLGILKEQIKNSLQKVQKKNLSEVIIAYEPVWAIGSTEAMTPEKVHEMSIFIKKILTDIFGQEEAVKVPILYGGSVNFRNASDIVSLGEVQGLLVGRESVNPPGFIEILKAIDLL